MFAVRSAEASDESGFKLVGLKNISVGQAKQFLSKLTATTVTHYSSPPTLLISGKPGEVARAQIILDLVDSPEQYVVQEILPLSAARSMPSNDQIASKLHPSLTRGASIGSFTVPPSKEANVRAIVDIYNDSVVAVAPAKLLEQIVAAVRPLSSLDAAIMQSKLAAGEPPEATAGRETSGLPEPKAAKFILAENGAAEAAPKDSPAEASANSESPAKTEPNAQPPVRTQPVAAAQPRVESTTINLEPATPNSVSAAETIATTSIPDGDQVVNLALADFEKLTVEQFLGLVGPYLQMDFLYDPKQPLFSSEVKINPNGKWRGPIKVKDLYPMLEDVLKFSQLAMTRSRGNLVTIVPVVDALDADPELQTEGVEAELGDGIVTRVFDLKYISPASAINLLNSMKMGTSPPIPKGRAIIVTGYAHRMSRIQALLNIIDEPGEKKKFRFRQLRYTMAETLAPKIQSLAEQLGTISITVSETTVDTSTAMAPSKPKQPNETTAQYQARLRAEAAARARARSTPTRTPTPNAEAEPEQPTVFLDSDQRTNRILMIGLDEQLDEVEKLIDTLDVAQQDLRTLELYRITHVEAEDVKNKLAELGIITPRTTSPYSQRITGGTQPPTATPGTTPVRPPITSRSGLYDEFEETPGEEPQVIVIEPTNSLLVNATAEQHEKIARILSYVDSEMLDADIPVQLYPLENQSPDHLAEVLDKLIHETIQGTDKDAKIEKVTRREDEEIIIVPEPNTFSLIVYASKKNQDWIANIIKNLDKRRPQVLIDVTLVQISKTDAFNYDLNILSSFPDLVETAGVTSAIMAGAEGTNLVSALLNSNRDRFIDFQSEGGNGTGFYGDKHINALLTAMQQKDYGRVLAKPKILVNDNEPGTISSTDVTYVTKQGSTIVQGQSGAVQTSIEYEPYDAGITLSITPHISSGDLLRLDIELNRSDFGTITGVKPPDTQESDIQTTVTIPDGSTIILGGLIKLNQSKGGTKVPILGDIPLIGGLFKSASNSDIQRNLYVFVKAEIIRPSESGVAQADMERISERNRTAFEEHEKEFQQYNDWSGIKPKPMKPEKVLDAQ